MGVERILTNDIITHINVLIDIDCDVNLANAQSWTKVLCTQNQHHIYPYIKVGGV